MKPKKVETKMVFRDPGTFVPMESDFEHPQGESMTVPDEAMSMTEILRRFSNGIVPSNYHEGSYADEEPDVDDEINPLSLPHYDLTDLTELIAESERVNRLAKDELEKRKGETDSKPKPVRQSPDITSDTAGDASDEGASKPNPRSAVEGVKPDRSERI